MIFEKRNPGLWETTMEIGEFFGEKKEEVWIKFRGPYTDEYNKMITVESELLIKTETGVEIKFITPEGKNEVRFVPPNALQKRHEFISKLISKCIIDHNFFMKNEKDENKPIKLTDKEVWQWVEERPNLNKHIIEEWRSNIPLAQKNVQK